MRTPSALSSNIERGMTKNRVSGAILLFASLLATPIASAQGDSAKPLRIVTTAAGGGSDFIARMLAGSISGPLGQNVIIDNRPAGVIPGDTVAKSAPDGNTVLLAGSGLWIGSLFQKVPYEPMRDFTPVILLSLDSSTLVVPPSLPVKSVKELIALAKAKPGELNFVSTSVGGALHLAAELFRVMAGVNIVGIAYKGAADATPDLMSGRAHLVFFGTASAMPLVASGKMRALAVTGTNRSPLAPDLPTMADTLPGYEAVGLTAIVGPAKVPAARVTQLNREFDRAIANPENRKKLLAVTEEIVGGPPERLDSAMKSDMVKWANLIKDAGIRNQ